MNLDPRNKTPSTTFQATPFLRLGFLRCVKRTEVASSVCAPIWRPLISRSFSSLDFPNVIFVVFAPHCCADGRVAALTSDEYNVAEQHAMTK